MTAYQKGIATIESKAARVAALLETPFNTVNRINLLLAATDAIAYHASGKIAGIHSLDSSCRLCSFCQDMQEAGQTNKEVICGQCYTRSFHEGALKAHEIPARILSTVEFTREELQAAPVPIGLLRLNCDGELINHTHAVNYIRLAATHPLTQFAIWTKRPGTLGKAIKQEGKPANLKVGISSPIINQPFTGDFSFADFVFTVYTPEGIKKALARGEHPCNGQSCRQCGFFCYSNAIAKNAGPVFIAELLKRPYNLTQAKYDALCKEIDEKTISTADELPFN